MISLFSVFLSELRKTLRRNGFYCLILTVAFAAIFTLVGFVTVCFLDDAKTKAYAQSEILSEYCLVYYTRKGLSIRNPADPTHLTDAEAYALYENLLEQLTSLKEIQCCFTKDCYPDIPDFRGESEFLKDYDAGIYNGMWVENSTTVKGVLFLEASLDTIGFPASEGRSFTHEDFGDSSAEEIPVMLGYRYRKLYEVGEVIEATLSEISATRFRVIGFLPKGFSMQVGRTFFENLDTFFIIPYFLPSDEAMREEVSPYILSQLIFDSGYFYILKESKEESVALLEEVLENNARLSEVFRVYENEVQAKTAAKKTLYDFYLALAILLFLFSAISLSYAVSHVIASDLRDLAIHMILGLDRRKVGLLMAAQIAVLLLAADLIAVAVSVPLSYILMIKLFINRYSLPAVAVLNLLTLGVTAFATEQALPKKNISDLLK